VVRPWRPQLPRLWSCPMGAEQPPRQSPREGSRPSARFDRARAAGPRGDFPLPGVAGGDLLRVRSGSSSYSTELEERRLGSRTAPTERAASCGDIDEVSIMATPLACSHGDMSS